MGNPQQHLENRHDGFIRLLETHQRALHKVCWVYGRNSHDRDDLFQEIVGQLWSSFARYDSQRTFSTWMYRVALNVAIDHQRRLNRRGTLSTTVEFNEELGIVSSHEEARQSQLVELRELLDQQSDADRALLLLYLEGHSHREIGEVLGISESNVSTRLNRLKQSMRQSVQQTVEGTIHAT